VTSLFAFETMLRTLTCCSALGLASGKVYFSETFGDGWEKRWTVSQWKDGEGTQGTWASTAGKWFGNEAEDKGIQTVEDSKFSALRPRSILLAMLEKS